MSAVAEALELYRRAAAYIESAGLVGEVQRQREANLAAFTETDLLRESAWVILCSGFRESVVRRVFSHISLCFCDWESADSIVEKYPACFISAQTCFNNTLKISAVVDVARHVHVRGFAAVKESILADPIEALRHFPYIGPVTVWHLAKNLGLDVAKPDRHLARTAAALGFADTHQLCYVVARESGEPVSVVDLIIWRYLADNPQHKIASRSGPEDRRPFSRRASVRPSGHSKRN
jgi:hypothetical protein